MSMHYCQQGAVKRTTVHRIYMHFMLRYGWQIQFLREDARTPLPRKLRFEYPEKILEMFDRYAEDKSSTARFEVEKEIRVGRGSFWLLLSEEHLRVLERVPTPKCVPAKETAARDSPQPANRSPRAVA